MSWANALKDLLQSKVDPIPPGFISLADVCKQFKLAERQTLNALRAMTAQGKVEKRMLTRLTSDGRPCKFMFYKWIGKK